MWGLKRGRWSYRPDLALKKCYAFPIHGSPWDGAATGSCGTHALACLLEKTPREAARFIPKGKSWWDDPDMVRILQKKGFELIPITERLVTNLPTGSATAVLRPEHVVLISTKQNRTEGTWCVFWNGFCYHSGSISRPDALELLNSPLMSAYVVWHPRWKQYATPTLAGIFLLHRMQLKRLEDALEFANIQILEQASTQAKLLKTSSKKTKKQLMRRPPKGVSRTRL
jgi:hypothetical protein